MKFPDIRKVLSWVNIEKPIERHTVFEPYSTRIVQILKRKTIKDRIYFMLRVKLDSKNVVMITQVDTKWEAYKVQVKDVLII